MWVRSNGAFEPIVERHLFDAAQAIIQNRSRRMSEEDMLDRLTDALPGAGTPFWLDHRRGRRTCLRAQLTAPASAAWGAPISSSASRPIATSDTSRSTGFCAACSRKSLPKPSQQIGKIGGRVEQDQRTQAADHQWRIHRRPLYCTVPGDCRWHLALADPLRHRPLARRDRRLAHGSRESDRPGLLHPAAHRPAWSASPAWRTQRARSRLLSLRYAGSTLRHGCPNKAR